jgi:flagellar basal-body rod modification protein FlgD
MSISSINATSSSAATPAAATSGALAGTQSEFLKLFMAQLQNQDPTSPQSATDMVAQLAQMSGVEQQTQTNTELTQLLAAQSSTSNASLSSLVGRQCNANIGAINVTNPSQIPPIEVSSTGAMTGASISVTNAAGQTVRTIPIPSGGGAIAWDGKDAAGNTLPAGAYTMSVNTGTTSSAISATWQGRVDSVQLSSTGSSLQMGGIQIQPGDITTIGGVLAATTGTGTGTMTTTGSSAISAAATANTLTTTQGISQ